jgi:hypothetical protein
MQQNITYSHTNRQFLHNRRNNLTCTTTLGFPCLPPDSAFTLQHNAEDWIVTKFSFGLAAVEGGDPEKHDPSGRTTLRHQVPVVLRNCNAERIRSRYWEGNPEELTIAPHFQESMSRPQHYVLPLGVTNTMRPSYTGHFAGTAPNYAPSSTINFSLSPSELYVPSRPAQSSFEFPTFHNTRSVAGPTYGYTQGYGMPFTAGRIPYEGADPSSYLSNLQTEPLQSSFEAFAHTASGPFNKVDDDTLDLEDDVLIGRSPTPVNENIAHVSASRLTPSQKACFNHFNVRKATHKDKKWYGDCFIVSLYAHCYRLDIEGNEQSMKILVAQSVSWPLGIQGRSPSYLRAAEQREIERRDMERSAHREELRRRIRRR